MVDDLPLGVCSHKRSGTHFLMATLWLNFELSDPSLRAVVHAGKRFVQPGGESRGPGSRVVIPWGRLWRTHGYFNPRWAGDPKRILYIVRDPVATLMSHWRFVDPLQLGDREVHVGWARALAWLRHARGYAGSCFWVRYEDLAGDGHDEVLAEIGERFGLRPRPDGFRRFVERVGWYPADTPTQPVEPPADLLESVRSVLPGEFLGYVVR